MNKISNGVRTMTPEQWFGLGAIKVSNGEPVWPEGGPHAEKAERSESKSKPRAAKKHAKR